MEVNVMFNELYSAYYNTVAKLIEKAINNELNNNTVTDIINENAFSESILQILPAIKEEKWKLIKSDYTTPIKHKPTMPLTDLEKSWLKAILSDKRIKLFDIHVVGLEDTEPLFKSDDYYVFDKYNDGDDFESEEYIKNFRTIVDAIKNNYGLKIRSYNRHGKVICKYVTPHLLEYSQKDDKFRLITSTNTINLGRIISCKKYAGDKLKETVYTPAKKQYVTLEINDERNALERVMLHFAHFEKSAEKINDKKYKVTINYPEDDETEIVIRVLSFGQFVKVIEPQSFVDLIKDRIEKQIQLFKQTKTAD